MELLRDPRLLYERYGRQLLVQGAAFEGQQALHALAAVFGADQSAVAQQAAEVAARYLVGAGLGRAVAPSAWAASLQGQDSQLVLADNPRDAAPPVAQFWFAERPYGASVDVALTDAKPGWTQEAGSAQEAGWAQGATTAARVATLRLDLGRAAEPVEATLLGALAADLIIADALQLEPLPALVTVDLRDAEAPQVAKTPRTAHAESPAPNPAAPSLLAELRAQAAQLAAIHGECAARYPQEACGLLLRQPDGGLLATAAPNLQDRYHALDPVAYPRTARTAYKLNERLLAKAADQGQQVVGIWHSHCDAGAYFSGEDVRCAAPDGQPLYPGAAYLVVSVIGGQVAGEAMYHWQAQAGAFAAETGSAVLSN